LIGLKPEGALRAHIKEKVKILREKERKEEGRKKGKKDKVPKKRKG
jgi:hypothetical protein